VYTQKAENPDTIKQYNGSTSLQQLKNIIQQNFRKIQDCQSSPFDHFQHDQIECQTKELGMNLK